MSDAGFSLIEVLVALTLTAMIALTGTTLFQQARLAQEVAGETASEIQDVALFHAAVTHDLAQISAQPIRVDLSQSASGLSVVRGSNGQSWTLVRSGRALLNTNAPTSDLARVQYQIEEGGVTRTVWPRRQPVATTPLVQQHLLKGAQKIQIRYFVDRAWTTEWRAERADLPRAIEVSWRNQRGEPFRHVFLVGASL